MQCSNPFKHNFSKKQISIKVNLKLFILNLWWTLFCIIARTITTAYPIWFHICWQSNKPALKIQPNLSCFCERCMYYDYCYAWKRNWVRIGSCVQIIRKMRRESPTITPAKPITIFLFPVTKTPAIQISAQRRKKGPLKSLWENHCANSSEEIVITSFRNYPIS